MIPWFLDRLDEALPRRATKLERTIGDYVRQTGLGNSPLTCSLDAKPNVPGSRRPHVGWAAARCALW
jgi:hypothetical protein